VLKEFHLALMNTIRDLKYNDTILASASENTHTGEFEEKAGGRQTEQAQRVEEHEEAINRLQSFSWQQEEMLQQLQASRMSTQHRLSQKSDSSRSNGNSQEAGSGPRRAG
jgi:hypothetical protein